MSKRRFAQVLKGFSLGLLLSGASLLACPVMAAPAAAGEFNDKELSLLENRYFAHAYGHDPIEKRLERLECLVFGATKGGSNPERLARLSKMVATRSATPLPVEKITNVPAGTAVTPSAGGPSAPASPPAGKNSSAQYPVLNTLEWRALKKTYSAESLDQRLDRLESKMFGQPAQTMAYIDRVERLKKTLGVTGSEAGKVDIPIARGPMPKAQPRGSGDDGQEIYGNPMEGSLPPMFNPFGSGSPLDTIFGATFDKMREDMNKQMQEAQRLGPGNWMLDPKTGNWVEMNSGKKVPLNGAAPRAVPSLPQSNTFRFNFQSPGMQIAPPSRSLNPNGSGTIQDLPPYADPNSI